MLAAVIYYIFLHCATAVYSFLGYGEEHDRGRQRSLKRMSDTGKEKEAEGERNGQEKMLTFFEYSRDYLSHSSLG